MSAPGANPLLKWVGGKRQLLPALRRFYPARFHQYVEPFFGSGAVFFDLHRAGRLDGCDVVLIDSNPDLVGCYETVRDTPDLVAGELDRLAAGHAAGGSRHYYEVRDQAFNPSRDARRLPDGRISYTPALAAMLIYLNRTGFNGLFRVNASGAFNVPVGRYAKPRIADRARLFAVSRALAGPKVRLLWASYEAARVMAEDEAFLYIDPPYAPVSRTANFTAYTAPGFGVADHRALQAMILDLARRGCRVLLSNSTAEHIVDLYERSDEATAAGLRALRVPARRSVNSNASRRGAVQEFLITNIAAGA
jgi:DNA adenine methylase